MTESFGSRATTRDAAGRVQLCPNSDLLRRIRLGEDSTLALKTMRFRGKRVDGPARDALADELAAFANARGGTVMLGVSAKTREVEGIPLERLDDVEIWVRSICNCSIKPALDADIVMMELPGVGEEPKPVVRIEVPRSLFIHKKLKTPLLVQKTPCCCCAS